MDSAIIKMHLIEINNTIASIKDDSDKVKVIYDNIIADIKDIQDSFISIADILKIIKDVLQQLTVKRDTKESANKDKSSEIEIHYQDGKEHTIYTTVERTCENCSSRKTTLNCKTCYSDFRNWTPQQNI